MRIIGIGDIHSRSLWKEIVAKEENENTVIVFIGDYFDTHGGGYSANRQITNFKDIITYKKSRSNNVILLFGNHDFHYIKGIGENYSGYQASYAIDIGEVIHEALSADLMQMCYVHDKYVFTHAGVTKTWCSNNNIDMSNLEQSVNDLFKFKPKSFMFTMGGNFSNTGDDTCQSPIWVRPSSLYEDKLDDVVYVVGHTTAKYLDVTKAEVFNMLLIDTLGTTGEYLILTDGVPSVGKIIDK